MIAVSRAITDLVLKNDLRYEAKSYQQSIR